MSKAVSRPRLIRHALRISGIATVFATASTLSFEVEELRLEKSVVSGADPIGVVLNGDPIHEEITRDALGQISVTLSNGRNVSFTGPAIEVIADRNARTDSEQNKLASAHFDNETLNVGNERLVSLREFVGLWARLDDIAAMVQAWRNLGFALHTVQDFYAHSTWVELQRPGLASLGRQGTVFGTPLSIGSTCSQFAVIPGSNLSTSYFEESQVLLGTYDYRYYPSLLASPKCAHGPTRWPSPFSVSNKTPGGAGINKDNDSREGHATAVALATGATVQFVKDILGDLRDDDAAICRLLGRKKQDCEPTDKPQIRFTFSNPDPPYFNQSGLIWAIVTGTSSVRCKDGHQRVWSYPHPSYMVLEFGEYRGNICQALRKLPDGSTAISVYSAAGFMDVPRGIITLTLEGEPPIDATISFSCYGPGDGVRPITCS
jgi:hypothetical protein